MRRSKSGFPTLAVAIMAGIAATLPWATPVAAHVVSTLELTTRRRLPVEFVRSLTDEALPDSLGRVPSHGQTGWNGIGVQAEAMMVLVDAAAWSDTARAEAAWASLDADFVAQRPDGWFEPADHPVEPASTAAWATVAWAGDVERALIATTNSALADRFRWRDALLLPKLRRTIDRLVTVADALDAVAAKDPTRALALAQTFVLAHGLFHEEAYAAIGERAIRMALARQRRDGGFAGPGAARAVVQAADLARLDAMTQYFPTPALEQASDRAAGWLVARVDRDGHIPGADADDARHVAVALAFQAARRDDAAMRATAERVAQGVRRPADR